jgi:hypothetical protein
VSSPEYEVAADLLVNKAALYAWSDLDLDASLPPALPGVYAWFFTEPPEVVPTSGCVTREGSYLLYVGISDRRSSMKCCLWRIANFGEISNSPHTGVAGDPAEQNRL